MVVVDPAGAATRALTAATVQRCWSEAWQDAQPLDATDPVRVGIISVEFIIIGISIVDRYHLYKLPVCCQSRTHPALLSTVNKILQEPVPTLVAEVRYVRSVEEAARAMHSALSDARTSHRGGSLIVAAELPGGPRHWLPLLPALESMPVTSIDSKAEDNDYRDRALGWQQGAARTALLRGLEATPWLAERLGVAAYAHLPLGCLTDDWVLDTADMLFARRCRDDQCLLWTVDSTVPPLVGSAKTVQVGGFDTKVAEVGRGGLSVLCTVVIQKHGQVVTPGAYRSVCVELKLQHLEVNAIAQSALLADLEHTTLSDDGAGVAAPFAALVKLVNAWLADATEHASPYVSSWLLSRACLF